MPGIPRDESFDATLALIRDPYGFIAARCGRYGSDVFRTRFLLRETICMTGPEAARLFYDRDRFVRAGAMPGRVRATLLGRGGVQGLDDAAHRHRKRMLMSLMTPGRIAELSGLVRARWRTHAERWASARGEVALYDEAREILARAACAWAGVPLAEHEAGRRTRELTALFAYAGAIGPAHWWSRLARRSAERWIGSVVRQVRAGGIDPPEGCPLRVVASHRDLGGELLAPRTAAVEVLNLLRPTVAVAVFVAQAAHALHLHPECRRALAGGQDRHAELFVQEVRRFYPFFPAVAARVRRDFDWNGHRFSRGTRVLLDLYGTDHDPRTWEAPEEFRPERFRTWDRSPFGFIPQGGGDHDAGHRCAGEWITIELMKAAVGFLAGGLSYDVPEQDLTIDRSRLPALPRSGFVMGNVRLNG